MSIFEKLNIDDELGIPVYPRAGEDSLTVGRVVYIHPKKRFFTLEYTTKEGKKIRESFIPYGPIACKEGKEQAEEYSQVRRAA